VISGDGKSCDVSFTTPTQLLNPSIAAVDPRKESTGSTSSLGQSIINWVNAQKQYSDSPIIHSMKLKLPFVAMPNFCDELPNCSGFMNAVMKLRRETWHCQLILVFEKYPDNFKRSWATGNFFDFNVEEGGAPGVFQGIPQPVNSTASNTTSSFQFSNQSPFACPGTSPAPFAQGTRADFYSGRKRRATEMNCFCFIVINEELVKLN
jgi:hypothetical protein